MTPIVTTYDIELLLVEFMLSDPEPVDFGPVLRVANTLYDKSPEPEGYCDLPEGFKEAWDDYKAGRVLPVQCGSAVDGGIGVTYEKPEKE